MPRPPALFQANEAGEIYLTDEGRRVLNRKGDDSVSDDTMVMLELIDRAPGMNEGDLRLCFVSVVEQYGNDALKAIRSGHVQFQRKH